MPNSKERNDASERIRHASIAGLIALALSFLYLLEPLDQLTWVFQSRLASNDASGEIIYVGSNENLSDPTNPRYRRDLANTVDALRRAGADKIYLDIVLDQPSDADADARLNTALRNFSGNAYLVRSKSTAFDGTDRWEHSTAAIADNVPEVSNDRWRNYLGYVWAAPFIVSHDGEKLPSLPASLVGINLISLDVFPIDYSFRLASIPTYRLSDIAYAQDDRTLAPFAGKSVVIGTSFSDEGTSNIPGHIDVPPSMVDIFAAESLKAGHIKIISGILTVLTVLSTLMLFGQTANKSVRYLMYAIITAGIPVAVYMTAQMGMKIYISGALALLLIYGGMRARSVWKSSFRLVDPATGLPSFAALEADKGARETAPAIIVARIHRFEEVRKTLPQDLHAQYTMRIIDRLKAAKKDTTIYVGPGHLIAWTFPEKEPALIREHLEGLRALFSSPLLVGGNQVDVGITFGVDITPSPNVARRVAAAVSAAERTTETYEPIEIAEMASDEDLIWNISLQARIDRALSNGEIYLIYQPKILVQTGELIGVEALVRWRDPVKGLIPPDHFIRQCENAGRMSHLTRHVLFEACSAGNAFEDHGMKLPIAVNISATLVHETAIVDMVRDTLEETGFDPHLLTLEITETFRISNFDRAAEVLAELASLGPKISMDDFGVGAASLEALHRLPFTELKIDRMFTLAMKSSAKAEGIVRSVLMMGKSLRIIVVAEGVEDDATLTLLRDSGCLVAQGFGISRPIAFDEILEYQGFKATSRLKNMV